MAYIKKRTTMILLLLLLLSIGLFVFSVFYYDKSFSRLGTVITQREDRIDALSGELESLDKNLAKVQSELELQIKREENLTNLYSDLKEDKEKVEGEKGVLGRALNETKIELFEAKSKINSLEDSLALQKSKYITLNNTYENILDDVNDICSKVSTLNISECRKY